MNLKFWKPKKTIKPVSIAREWFNSIVFAVIAATLIRWTAVEAYVVPTPSMENSILVGDYLFVSKFHYGTRTTSTPLQIPLTHQKIWGTDIPSYLNWIELPAYRLAGISEVKREDVVVFNVPPRSLNDGIDHPIQLKTNYVKRCVGIPGDRFEIKDSGIIVNGIALQLPANMKLRYRVTAKDEITPRNLHKLGLDKNDYTFLGRSNEDKAVYKMLLTVEQLENLKAAPYIVLMDEDLLEHDRPEDNIFPSATYAPWNGDQYGPIVIPKKGMQIIINDSTLAFYGETIKLYEHHEQIEMGDGKLIIHGKTLKEYTFRQNYYFMVGDNRHNSFDSRYWGFVPEDHIVGKALFIWLSWDDEAEILNKVRWERLFNLIE